MNTKKAQITLFMIIGILIVVGGFAVYYFLSPREIEAEALDVTPIKEYVTSCLDSTTKEALVKIGERGGYISDELSVDSLDIGFEKIYYGIEAPELINDTTWINFKFDFGITVPNPFPAPPEYPCQDFDGECFRPGLFGRITLPSLDSAKADLENYINMNLGQCLNLSVFREQGFEIKEGEKTATLTIAPATVIANLAYPLEISRQEQKVKLESFSSTINVRFGKILLFAWDLAFAETSDITFDITSISRDGIAVTKYSNYQSTIVNPRYDDLIVVQDSMFKVDGEPYQFRFMRKNRGPALYNVNTIGTGTRCKSDLNYFYDLIDPDEENVVKECYIDTSNNKLTIEDREGLKDWEE